MNPVVRRAAAWVVPALLTPFLVLADPAPAMAASTCQPSISVHYLLRPVTPIVYEGRTQCVINVYQSGQTELYNSQGRLVSSGKTYNCYCTIGASRGSYKWGVLEQRYILKYRSRITLPAGYIWGPIRSACTGSGTRTINCLDRFAFRLTVTQSGPLTARLPAVVAVRQ